MRPKKKTFCFISNWAHIPLKRKYSARYAYYIVQYYYVNTVLECNKPILTPICSVISLILKEIREQLRAQTSNRDFAVLHHYQP